LELFAFDYYSHIHKLSQNLYAAKKILKFLLPERIREELKVVFYQGNSQKMAYSLVRERMKFLLFEKQDDSVKSHTSSKEEINADRKLKYGDLTSSSFYRGLHAILEGRGPHESGRPPYLLPDEVTILVQRIRMLCLSKKTPSKAEVQQMVF
jgi:hypothetical protein